MQLSHQFDLDGSDGDHLRCQLDGNRQQRRRGEKLGCCEPTRGCAECTTHQGSGLHELLGDLFVGSSGKLLAQRLRVSDGYVRGEVDHYVGDPPAGADRSESRRFRTPGQNRNQGGEGRCSGFGVRIIGCRLGYQLAELPGIDRLGSPT